SVRRMRVASTQPLRYPPTAPTSVPNAEARSADRTPIDNETRAPHSTRVSTSRPSSSVPNQCANDGAARRLARSSDSGAYGETTGASTARRATTARRTSGIRCTPPDSGLGTPALDIGCEARDAVGELSAPGGLARVLSPLTRRLAD